jgi:hypothetical protein
MRWIGALLLLLALSASTRACECNHSRESALSHAFRESHPRTIDKRPAYAVHRSIIIIAGVVYALGARRAGRA